VISQVLPAYGISPRSTIRLVARRTLRTLTTLTSATSGANLALVTGTFFVPLDPARALVAKIHEPTTQYEREAVETGVSARQWRPTRSPRSRTSRRKMSSRLRTASADVDQSAHDGGAGRPPI